MQSWAWGEFEEVCGHRVFRLGLYKAEALTAVLQAIHIHSKRATFLYVPHGPIWHTNIIPADSWKEGQFAADLPTMRKDLGYFTQELKRIAHGIVTGKHTKMT